MPKKYTVLLDTMEKVKLFNNLAQTYKSDIDVIVGRYSIDAKSILGLFALDLSKPVTVTMLSDDMWELRKFDLEIDEFRVK